VINHPIAKATAAAAFMTEDRVLQLFLPSLVTMLPDVATIEPCWWRRLSQSKSSIARCNKSHRPGYVGIGQKRVSWTVLYLYYWRKVLRIHIEDQVNERAAVLGCSIGKRRPSVHRKPNQAP